jgi:hypothetical protein
MLVRNRISGVALGIQYEPNEFTPNNCYREQHPTESRQKFFNEETTAAQNQRAISPGSTLSMA